MLPEYVSPEDWESANPSPPFPHDLFPEKVLSFEKGPTMKPPPSPSIVEKLPKDELPRKALDEESATKNPCALFVAVFFSTRLLLASARTNPNVTFPVAVLFKSVFPVEKASTPMPVPNPVAVQFLIITPLWVAIRIPNPSPEPLTTCLAQSSVTLSAPDHDVAIVIRRELRVRRDDQRA